MIRTKVLGVGSYLPPRVVTNQELTQWMDTSDEWIVQRSGIKERRWVDPNDPCTATSDLALKAAQQALEKANVKADELDMIFLATLSPDHDFPGTGHYLQAKLGISGIPAIDVRQQCPGFIFGLSMADQFIRSGQAKKILLVGAEVHSKGLDLSTRGRDVTVLFGDGAGALVLGASEVSSPQDSQVFSTHLHSDGQFGDELTIAAPGTAFVGRDRVSAELVEQGCFFPKMNGKLVFQHAVKRMPEVLLEALNANGKKPSDVDMFFFHQANLRINEFAAKSLEIPPEKVFNTIDRFANTSAASIPLGLSTAVQEGVLKPGMLVATVAFGSGFSWASSLIRW